MQDHIFYSPLEFQNEFNRKNVCSIFGGSFDPIHQGHICDLVTLLELSNTVIIAPTAQNPWKPAQSSTLKLRLEMIEIVLKAEDIPYSKDLKGTGLILSELEYSFSIELHEKIKEQRETKYPAESIFWAIGDDLRDSAHKWKNWEEAGSDFIVLPTLEGYSGTAIRKKSLKPHPAIEQYIKNHQLYA